MRAFFLFIATRQKELRHIKHVERDFSLSFYFFFLSGNRLRLGVSLETAVSCLTGNNLRQFANERNTAIDFLSQAFALITAIYVKCFCPGVIGVL